VDKNAEFGIWEPVLHHVTLSFSRKAVMYS
jgi:hypothetical protein